MSEFVKINKCPVKINKCTRCNMPVSYEGLSLDELGICEICRASEEKMAINWKKKRKELEKIFDKYRSKDNYDCIVPVSGGKDSAYQMHMLKHEFNMNPLAVTYSHNLFSKEGRHNLKTMLEQLDIDHIEYTPKRSLVNRMMTKSLSLIGDSCWHCHAGIGAFPLQMAIKLNIKLLVWGESAAEWGKCSTYSNPLNYDEDYFRKVSTKKGTDEMLRVNTSISKQEVPFFYPPSAEQFKESKLQGIFMGDYIFWDGEYFTEFLVKHYGWKERKVEGTYKQYKSAECILTGAHDYSKYVKRGFGRGTDFATQDLRQGIISLDEFDELSNAYDSEEPLILDYYLKKTGMTKKEFYDTLIGMREESGKELFDTGQKNIFVDYKKNIIENNSELNDEEFFERLIREKENLFKG
jgi:N-acetyl sugar amidotransferase